MGVLILLLLLLPPALLPHKGEVLIYGNEEREASGSLGRRFRGGSGHGEKPGEEDDSDCGDVGGKLVHFDGPLAFMAMTCCVRRRRSRARVPIGQCTRQHWRMTTL
jgi:hypothetical protein